MRGSGLQRRPASAHPAVSMPRAASANRSEQSPACAPSEIQHLFVIPPNKRKLANIFSTTSLTCSFRGLACLLRRQRNEKHHDDAARRLDNRRPVGRAQSVRQPIANQTTLDSYLLELHWSVRYQATAAIRDLGCPLLLALAGKSSWMRCSRRKK